jgi:hypothetical protein
MWTVDGDTVTTITARQVTCPECLAAAGSDCVGTLRKNGTRRERTTNHLSRWSAYLDAARSNGARVKQVEYHR